MKSKNTEAASSALLDMDKIMKSIKESSKETVKDMLSEAVKTALRDSVEDDDDKDEETDDDDMEIIDGKDTTDNKSQKASPKSSKKKDDSDDSDDDDDSQDEDDSDDDDDFDTESGDTADDTETDDAEADNGEDWQDLDDYKVGDDTYDLSGEKDYDTVVKVYKRLKDGDEVVVAKPTDGKIDLTDNGTGAEYVIDLGTDDTESDEGTGEPSMAVNEEFEGDDDGSFNDDADDDFDMEPDNDLDMTDGNSYDLDVNTSSDDLSDDSNDISVDTDDSDDFSLDTDDDDYDDNPDDFDPESDDLDPQSEYDDYSADDESPAGLPDNLDEKRNKMKKERIYEIDLGYTDNYQDKDVMTGLSNDEPSPSGRSWHKGVPTGTSKPWAGSTSGKGKPFGNGNSVDECGDFGGDDSYVEEGTNVGGAVQQRTSSKSHIPSGRKNYGPKVKRHVSTSEDGYSETVDEAYKKQLKGLREAVVELKKNLNEAYVTNVNLGKITKLFMENATSQSEKADIVERFTNEAKTVKDSERLYKTIQNELSKKTNSGKNLTLENKTVRVKPDKILNENTAASKDLMKTIDLMKRVENC